MLGSSLPHLALTTILQSTGYYFQFVEEETEGDKITIQDHPAYLSTVLHILYVSQGIQELVIGAGIVLCTSQMFHFILTMVLSGQVLR